MTLRLFYHTDLFIQRNYNKLTKCLITVILFTEKNTIIPTIRDNMLLGEDYNGPSHIVDFYCNI